MTYVSNEMSNEIIMSRITRGNDCNARIKQRFAHLEPLTQEGSRERLHKTLE